jgi:ethanolamine utilization protein EutN
MTMTGSYNLAGNVPPGVWPLAYVVTTGEIGKLLVVQTLDRHLKESGKPMVAVDSVGAGVGELVFWCRGKEASFPFKREDTPTDCTIIGIVDSEQHVTNGK